MILLTGDLADDEASSTLRATADLFEKSAAVTKDKDKREVLLEYAQLYRELVELSDKSRAEVDDELEDRESRSTDPASRFVRDCRIARRD